MIANTAKAGLWAFVILASGAAYAQHPPVQSPQDEACRSEAGRRVFSDPNPSGLGLYERGRHYWIECMRRSERLQKRSKA